MDNGLIFPYPRVSARDEPVCANHPNLPVTAPFGVGAGRGAWEPGR